MDPDYDNIIAFLPVLIRLTRLAPTPLIATDIYAAANRHVHRLNGEELRELLELIIAVHISIW